MFDQVLQYSMCTVAVGAVGWLVVGLGLGLEADLGSSFDSSSSAGDSFSFLADFLTDLLRASTLGVLDLVFFSVTALRDLGFLDFFYAATTSSELSSSACIYESIALLIRPLVIEVRVVAILMGVGSDKSLVRLFCFFTREGSDKSLLLLFINLNYNE